MRIQMIFLYLRLLLLLIKTEPAPALYGDEVLHCDRKIRSGQKHA